MEGIDLSSLVPPVTMFDRGIDKRKEMAPVNILFHSFSESAIEALDQVNKLETNANNLTQQLALGEVNNIHEVTIAAEKAEIAVNFVTTIRDKVIRAYEEIMAMGR